MEKREVLEIYNRLLSTISYMKQDDMSIEVRVRHENIQKILLDKITEILEK